MARRGPAGLRGRGIRLARAQGPPATRTWTALVVPVRPAPAGHRGRGARAHPVQAGDVRRRPVHGHLHRRLRRPRGADRDLGGRGHRAGDGLPRRPLRDHRPARRARPAERAAALARGRSRAAGPRSVRGAVRHRRQDHRRLPAVVAEFEKDVDEVESRGLLPRRSARGRPGLPAQAGADRVQALGDAARSHRCCGWPPANCRSSRPRPRPTSASWPTTTPRPARRWRPSTRC